MYGEGASLYSVLIVEDEPAVRRSLVNKIRWEEMGLAVTGTAQNAEEAYEIIKETPPDIILLDMRMPGMGGLAFLNILNREFPDIKIIILSGHSDFDYVRHALRCGASDYLLKPIVKEDLRAALDKVIGAIREERDQNRRSTRNQMLLNESLPLLRNMLLNKLLTGIQMDREAVLRRLRFLGVELQFPWYVVAVIKNRQPGRDEADLHERHLARLFRPGERHELVHPTVHERGRFSAAACRQRVRVYFRLQPEGWDPGAAGGAVPDLHPQHRNVQQIHDSRGGQRPVRQAGRSAQAVPEHLVRLRQNEARAGVRRLFCQPFLRRGPARQSHQRVRNAGFHQQYRAR
jgi:DNA-binding NarL/FixJ family response regulator